MAAIRPILGASGDRIDTGRRNRRGSHRAVGLVAKKPDGLNAIHRAQLISGSGDPEQLLVEHCSVAVRRSAFARVCVRAVGGVAWPQVVVVCELLAWLDAAQRVNEHPVSFSSRLAVGVAGVIDEPDAV